MAGRWAPVTWCDGLLLLSIATLVIRCPYSKVEESFNAQAVHDLLHSMGVFGRGNDRIEQFQSFDHLSFPGVVPRTALGALLLSIVQYPIEIILRGVFNGSLPKITSQYVCRLLLGTASWASITAFAAALGDKLSSDGAVPPARAANALRIRGLFTLLIATSFHVPFYSSRTIPNTFALVLVQAAWAMWLRGKPYAAIAVVTVAATIFRCDMIVLLAPMGLQLLLSREVEPFRAIATGAVTAALSLLLSVCVDSVFWGRLLWPEGGVLLFNTVENKSSHWGEMPWHWYGSSAIPRAMHVNLFLCALGAAGVRLDWDSLLVAGPLQQRVRRFVGSGGGEAHALAYYLAPPVIFIALYSILPHKELRFILPVLPLLASPAAIFLHKALPSGGDWLFGAIGLKIEGGLRKKKKKKGYPGLFVALLAMYICVNMVVTEYIFTAAAVVNYPGGAALHRLLNTHIPEAYNRSMKAVYSCHIDEVAASTGVTRFGQENAESWSYGVVYSKEEKLQSYSQFDFLLTADKSVLGKDRHFLVAAVVMGFHSLRLKRPTSISEVFGTIQLTLAPAIYILKNKSLN